MSLQSIHKVCLTLALALILTSVAHAGPVVTFNTTPSGGEFTYNLFLDNTVSSYIVSGLIVVNGFSVFNLDGSSSITAPPEANGCPCEAWGFVPPFPPFADNLAFFSPDAGGDISPGSTLGGFSFDSSKNPSSLAPGNFDIVLIERGGALHDIGDIVPEAGSLTLLALGASLLTVFRRGFARVRGTPDGRGYRR